MLKSNAYLRSLRFAGVRDKFLTIKSSGTAHKKVRIAYYLVPAFIFTGIAFSHFLQVSFGIYLKYQALIDSYHKNKMDQKYIQNLENLDENSKEQINKMKNEKLISDSILAPPMGQIGQSKAAIWDNKIYLNPN